MQRSRARIAVPDNRPNILDFFSSRILARSLNRLFVGRRKRGQRRSSGGPSATPLSLGKRTGRILRAAAFFVPNRQTPLPTGNSTQTGISDEQIEYQVDRGMES